MPKIDYKERRAEKQERYEELAEKNHTKANEEFEQSRKMADVIPFGQPILVGHHSEKSDRNYRKRIDNKMRKSIETSKKADYYDNKVKSMKTNSAIFSDDPEAIKKLEAKIKGLEAKRVLVKALPIKPRDYSFSEIDMRSVHLTSIGTDIRTAKKRIEKLKELDKVQPQEFKNNLITLEVNKDENRIMIYFPGKPDDETRTKLKRHGFRWSPRNQAWQSYINQWNLDFGKEEILKLV